MEIHIHLFDWEAIAAGFVEVALMAALGVFFWKN